MSKEALEEKDIGNDLVGLLKMSLYGTRDAPAQWEAYLAKEGFKGVHAAVKANSTEGVETLTPVMAHR